MLYLSRPLLAWMARRWPINEGEAEVLGELDRYLATGQLPTDARRLDVGAAEYAHGILQRLALEEERALERRAEQEERAREAMVRRVQEDAAEQDRAWEERDRLRRQRLAHQQVRKKNLYLPQWLIHK
jgi:anti-sigma-K factor RskA